MRRTGSYRLWYLVCVDEIVSAEFITWVILDLAANMIGRSNARRGARRMFAVLQNRRLNQHIAYTIVDEVRQFFHHNSAFNPKLCQVFATLFPDPIPDLPKSTSE